MIISIIAAIAENNGIGKNNDLLWHLPVDMKYFKDTTLGHYVLAGRKNYISIPEKYRPLVGRSNIIATHDKKFKAPNAVVVNSIQEGIELAKNNGEAELFIIGGGEIYKQTINLCDKLYITHVAANPDADTFFPKIDADKFKKISSTLFVSNEKNVFDMEFAVYERVR